MKIKPKKLVTSFQTFTCTTKSEMRQPEKQKIKSIGKFILRDGKRKCCVCKGIPRIRIAKKLQGFYSTSMPYPHRADCKNQ